MSEKSIQQILWYWAQGRKHDLMIPNTCLYGWESDMLSITRAGTVHEYEIKISRADYRNDAKKDRAQKIRTGPNHFWYVVPDGLITQNDLPEYAGLLYVRNHDVVSAQNIVIVRQAPKLHGIGASQEQLRQMTRSMMYRFWRMRYEAL